MHTPEAPWGEASFEQDRDWYGHLSSYPEDNASKSHYSVAKARALADPTFDFFDEIMPTHRPKHDIGRYVMRHSIPVPIISTMSEWQDALMSETAMLRSEHPQDYAGESGLYSSHRFILTKTYPFDEDGYPDEQYGISEDGRSRVLHRRYSGPPEATLSLGPIDILSNPLMAERHLGSSAVNAAVSEMLRQGLHNGMINPHAYMRWRYWDRENESHMLDAQSMRYKHTVVPDFLRVSRWRYVPGNNIRIVRDNVIEGKYYIGGDRAHHHWEVVDGQDAPDAEAHTKTGYRGTPSSKTLEYTLPTRKIIELYEKVRTLPYFDTTQVPLMEMQYGYDGKIHFLQYLKTGLKLAGTEEFALPSGPNVVTSYDTRGSTSPNGEKVRIYLDPRVFTRRMKDQAFFADHNLHARAAQVASFMSRAMIVNTMLSFKDNHWSSSPLYQAPVAIGTWNGECEVEKRFAEVSRQKPQRNMHTEDTQVEYVDAIVTSNGRRATIESDWQLKTEEVN